MKRRRKLVVAAGTMVAGLGFLLCFGKLMLTERELNAGQEGQVAGAGRPGSDDGRSLAGASEPRMAGLSSVSFEEQSFHTNEDFAAALVGFEEKTGLWAQARGVKTNKFFRAWFAHDRVAALQAVSSLPRQPSSFRVQALDKGISYYLDSPLEFIDEAFALLRKPEAESAVGKLFARKTWDSPSEMYELLSETLDQGTVKELAVRVFFSQHAKDDFREAIGIAVKLPYPEDRAVAWEAISNCPLHLSDDEVAWAIEQGLPPSLGDKLRGDASQPGLR